MTTIITISNLAGGDARTFRVRNGIVPDAAIRHARRIQRATQMDFRCDDESAADQIQQAIDETED